MLYHIRLVLLSVRPARRLVKKAKADAEDEAGKEGGAGDEEETSPEAEPETDETPKKVGDVTEKPANTQQITGAGGNNVLLGKHTLDHIDAHNRTGEGSAFAGGNVGEKEIKKLINKIPEDFYEKVKDGGSPIFTVKLKDKDGNPKVAGHNLVQKSKDILKKNPNAKKIMINKQVGSDPKTKKPIMKAVPGYVVDDDISDYETDMVSVIAVPSNPDYMADELQSDPGVKADMESGNSFSIATSFPGDPTVPTADKWEDSDHAIIIPNGGKGADTKNWVTGGNDDKKDAEPTSEPKTEPRKEPEQIGVIRKDMSDDEKTEAAEKEFEGTFQNDEFENSDEYKEVEEKLIDMAKSVPGGWPSGPGDYTPPRDAIEKFVKQNPEFIKKHIGDEYADELYNGEEGEENYSVRDGIAIGVEKDLEELFQFTIAPDYLTKHGYNDMDESTKPIKLRDLIKL